MKNFLILSLTLLPTLAFAWNVGDKAGNGIFLFEEQVEIYSNGWIGYSLQNSNELSDQAKVAIVGEGKTAMFDGILSINCTNGKYYWITASNGYEGSSLAEAVENVPAQVIANATKVFCK